MELCSLHILKSMPLPLHPVKGTEVYLKSTMRKWERREQESETSSTQEAKPWGWEGRWLGRGGRGVF